MFNERVNSRSEVFLFPYLDGYLLTAPTIGLVTLISSETAQSVRVLASGSENGNPLEADLQKFFEKTGLLPLLTSSLEPTFSGENGNAKWSPYYVTFSVTQKCSLRCTYCYASGGRLDDRDIPWPIAKGAVDLIIENAARDAVRAEIGFLGEGEASSNWSMFKKIVTYFREQCSKESVEGRVSMNTNGILSSEQVSYIARHCDHVTISVDGVEAVHDRCRVLPGGGGSFALVEKTLQRFDSLHVKYLLRATVGIDGVERMKQFVDFVGENLQGKMIHFEPMFDHSVITNLDGPSPDAVTFIENYRRAKRASFDYGIEVLYSGVSANRASSSFCGTANAQNFVVTTGGQISSCVEVLQKSDPRADLFQYGEWDEDNARFTVDRSKIMGLGKLGVQWMPKCQGCLAKYSCSGDCYAKTATLGDIWSSGYGYRCHINRELLRDELIHQLLMASVEQSSALKSGAGSGLG